MQSTYGQGTGGLWAANNARSWGDKITNRAGGADAVNTGADYFVGYPTGTIYYPITTKNSKETFLDKNYKIVDIKDMEADDPKSVSPDSNSIVFVVEANKGLFKKLGISIGDKLLLKGKKVIFSKKT